MTLSLYIHIPFCASKCEYCDFFSIPDTGSKLHEQVLDSIIREIENRLEQIDSPRIETIFIGGGTPSIISPELFNRFLQKLNDITKPVLNPGVEFSCEANVGSCSKEFMDSAAANGINRLSLGVQSFNRKILNTLGRKCSVENIHDSVSFIRDYWKGFFSMDLISGVSEEGFNDIKRAVRLEPDHLSVYQLTVEEGTLLHSQIASGEKGSPDDAFQSEAIEKIGMMLRQEGFIRYEISNYASHDRVCRHNLRYWNMQSYIGVGPSAVSSLYFDDRQMRISNGKNILQYIEQNFSKNTDDFVETENISDSDFMIEHYLMGYRLCTGIDEEIFTSRFGKKSSEFIPATIEKWSKKGLLDEKLSALNDKGLLFLDSFLSDIYCEITLSK